MSASAMLCIFVQGPRVWNNLPAELCIPDICHALHTCLLVQGPRVWNNLPAELCTPDISLATFRNLRHSCYICNCYPAHLQLFPILHYINVLNNNNNNTVQSRHSRPILRRGSRKKHLGAWPPP